MKVRLKTSLAGDGFSHAFGAEIEMNDAEAARFIERGLAEPIEDTKPAAAPAVVAESKPTRKRKG